MGKPQAIRDLEQLAQAMDGGQHDTRVQEYADRQPVKGDAAHLS
jgi:hypothetical protein